MPAPTIAATQRLASAEQHRARALGGADQLDRRLDDDSELALGAADHAEPIEPARVGRGAAEVEDVAVEGDEPYAQQIVDCHAVFQAVRAAGVHPDIAADRAGELRGRVGRVEEAVRRDRFGDGEIGDARLDPRVAVGEVDLEDAVHLAEAEDDRVLLRDRAARQRRAGAARHDVDPAVAAEAHDTRDLVDRARQGDRERQAAIGGQRVGLEGASSGDVGDQTVGRQDRGEAGDDLVAPRQDRRIGRRKGDLRHGRRLPCVVAAGAVAGRAPQIIHGTPSRRKTTSGAARQASPYARRVRPSARVMTRSSARLGKSVGTVQLKNLLRRIA